MSRAATNADTSDKPSSKESSAEPAVTYHDSELKYFQKEKERLQSSRDKYLSETKKPERKEYTPDIFTSLEPYTDLIVYNKALDAPVATPRFNYKIRNTATGLCDPVVSYNMDVDFDTPRSSPASVKSRTSTQDSGSRRSDERETKTRNDQKKRKSQQPRQEKSASVPLFPTVTAVRNKMTGEELNYSHVPQLRDELRKTYSANAERRIEHDYQMTKTEFHTRQLDRIDEYHPDSWPTIRKAYFAYLQNNQGSKRAVHECVREAEKGNDPKKDDGNKRTTSSKEAEKVGSAKDKNSDKRNVSSSKNDQKKNGTDNQTASSKDAEKIGSTQDENSGRRSVISSKNDPKIKETDKGTANSKDVERVGSAKDDKSDTNGKEQTKTTRRMKGGRERRERRS